MDLESCAASKPSASPLFLLGSLASHSQGSSWLLLPFPTFWFDSRTNPSHNPLPTLNTGAAPSSSFPSMKFLTFATVVGTASAFLAPAPMHTRTQGRVSTLSFLQSCVCSVHVIGRDLGVAVALLSVELLEQPQAQDEGGGG